LFYRRVNDHTIHAICGHAPLTMGKKYMEVTLRTRMEAMAAFPRYRIDDVAQAAAE
jgi:hypothetical protein